MCSVVMPACWQEWAAHQQDASKCFQQGRPACPPVSHSAGTGSVWKAKPGPDLLTPAGIRQVADSVGGNTSEECEIEPGSAQRSDVLEMNRKKPALVQKREHSYETVSNPQPNNKCRISSKFRRQQCADWFCVPNWNLIFMSEIVSRSADKSQC